MSKLENKDCFVDQLEIYENCFLLADAKSTLGYCGTGAIEHSSYFEDGCHGLSVSRFPLRTE